MMSDLSVLYIDDESENLVLLKYLFTDEFLIRTALNYEEAVRLLEIHDDIKIILCDQRMPGKKGVDILEEFYNRYPDKLRILITAYSDIQVITDAVNRAKIFHYIPKPIDENNFKEVIDKAMAAVRSYNRS
jgi:response regulator RpfG family c-di-GMP phosphodiesterase